MTQLTEAYDHIDEIKSLFSEYTAMLVSIDPSFSIYLDIQHYVRKPGILRQSMPFLAADCILPFMTAKLPDA